MTNQAESFKQINARYLFSEAHHLVEAEASTRSKEIEPNVFLFPDGSLMQIFRFGVRTYDSIATYESQKPKQHNPVIQFSDCYSA